VANIGFPVIPAWPYTWPLSVQAGSKGTARGRGRITPSSWADADARRLSGRCHARPPPASVIRPIRG